MSYASNLEEALKVIERNKDYINQLKASGYKVPESYERIEKEIKDIKSDPTRTGISTERLKNIKYLFNKNVIASRSRLDTTMTIPHVGEVELMPHKTIRASSKKNLQEYSDILNNLFEKYRDEIDPAKYPNARPTIQLKALENYANALGIDLDDMDFTKLGDKSVESQRLAAIKAFLERNIAQLPTHISPFKEEIREKIGEENHRKFLASIGYTPTDIDLFERYIDSSQFWQMIHKANYSSSQESGKHEIRDVVSRLKETLTRADKKDFEDLQIKLRNATNYRQVDSFVKGVLRKKYKSGKL